MNVKITDSDMPGLYQSANNTSTTEQKKYFNSVVGYLFLLILASLFAYFSNDYSYPILKIVSALFFFITLCIMIWQRVTKPDDIWYNGRAVAESVKTRSWRWMMRAEPYIDCDEIGVMRKNFVCDLKTILKQNESLIGKLDISASVEDPISKTMTDVRSLCIEDRFSIYMIERVKDQSSWYMNKAKYNKKKSGFWFWMTLGLHALAIILLLYNIKEPQLRLPIDIIALCASSALTWLQTKKHNELSSSYSLTAHEITLIKSEITIFNGESDFSDYIMNCENAFSREHTQWFARKTN